MPERLRRSAPASLPAGTLLLALLTLAYPLLVYLSLERLPPRALAALLLAMALLRVAASARARSALGTWAARAPAAAALLLAACSWLGNGWLPLKLYPVAVNALLLALFALSLRWPPSAVERLARLAEPDLPPAAQAYTRRVTQVWCLFFAANGAAALATALYASSAVWTLYNGLIAYCLMGALMGAEWLVRRRVRARMGAAPTGP